MSAGFGNCFDQKVAILFRNFRKLLQRNFLQIFRRVNILDKLIHRNFQIACCAFCAEAKTLLICAIYLYMFNFFYLPCRLDESPAARISLSIRATKSSAININPSAFLPSPRTAFLACAIKSLTRSSASAIGIIFK